MMVSATVRGWCMGVVSCDGQCDSQGVVYGSGQCHSRGGGVWEWSVVMVSATVRGWCMGVVSATVRGWCMGVVSCDGQCHSIPSEVNSTIFEKGGP